MSIKQYILDNRHALIRRAVKITGGAFLGSLATALFTAPEDDGDILVEGIVNNGEEAILEPDEEVEITINTQDKEEEN